MAGFPCQPFSAAGLRKGENDFRGKIIFNVTETIQKSLPKVFILENVVGFVNAAGGAMFKKVLNKLEKIKEGNSEAYDVHHEIVNAIEHGVPQSRKRLFIVGIQKEAPDR